MSFQAYLDNIEIKPVKLQPKLSPTPKLLALRQNLRPVKLQPGLRQSTSSGMGMPWHWRTS